MLSLECVLLSERPEALADWQLPLEDFSAAIDAWKESIELQPDSPDAHTSTSHLQARVPLAYLLYRTDLASAYIMMPLARPDLALQHLRCVEGFGIHGQAPELTKCFCA